MPLREDSPGGRVDAYWVDDQEAYTTALRQIVADLGFSRVVELWEGGPLTSEDRKRRKGWDTEQELELDVANWEPIYKGLETYSTPPSADWLVYASHEDTLAIAGAELADRVAVKHQGLTPFGHLRERIPGPDPDP